MASSSSGVNPLGFLIFIVIIIVGIYAYRKNFSGGSALGAATSRRVTLSEEMTKKFETIFAEPTERYIASLGNGYIVNFFASSKVANGFSVISNRRVYFKGKCYYKENGKLRKSFEERTVDLKDVTGTGYTRENPLYLLVTAIVSLVVVIVDVIASAMVESPSTTVANVGAGILLVALMSMCVSISLYSLKRHNFFEISFAGGKIAFDSNLYDKSEIDDFQKQIRRAKDNVVESAHAQVAAAAQPQAVVQTNSKLGIADELKKYADLLEQKLITQEEFEELKKNLLSSGNK